MTTSVYYSDNYALAANARTELSKTASNLRLGESVWVKASMVVPTTGRTAGDIIKFCPVVAGVRVVAGYIQATATNSSFTMDLGWTSAPTAIVAASTTVASATTVDLTAVQRSASTVSAAGDELIGTLGGTVGSTATTITVCLQLVNVGS